MENLITQPNSAFSLADFTSPALIIPFLRGQDAAAVIQELSVALQREGCVNDLLQFYHAALNREYLSSTATEPGFALPHALVQGLAQPCFAVGRCPVPIPWVSQAKPLVQLVFVLTVPETDARAYLALISGLARLGKDRQRLESFLKASDSFQMFDALKQVKVRCNSASALKNIPEPCGA